MRLSRCSARSTSAEDAGAFASARFEIGAREVLQQLLIERKVPEDALRKRRRAVARDTRFDHDRLAQELGCYGIQCAAPVEDSRVVDCVDHAQEPIDIPAEKCRRRCEPFVLLDPRGAERRNQSPETAGTVVCSRARRLTILRSPPGMIAG
jgi:hypothetical protein